MTKRLIICNICRKKENSENIYLFPWRDRNYKTIYKNKLDEEIKYHWDYKENILNDHKYISNLHEKILINLRDNLNFIHKEKKSVLFWRIVLGPWLRYFLEASYDRYQQIKFFLLQSSSSFEIEEYNYNSDLLFPKSVESLAKYIFDSEEWNYNICLKIFKFLKAKNIFIKVIDDPIIKDRFEKFIKKADKNNYKKLSILNKANFYKKHKYCVFKNTLNLKNELFLNLLLGQIPILNNPEVIFNENLFDKNIRKKLKVNFNVENKFEDFIKNFLKSQLPSVYLENYKFQYSLINHYKLPKDPKVILGTSQLYFNTPLMFYTAKNLDENNSKLFYLQHGAEYGASEIAYGEDHELKISNTFFSWGWKKENFNINPIGISRSTSSFKNINYKKNKKILILIRSSNPYFRISSSLYGFKNWINYINDTSNLPSLLKSNIKDNIIARFTRNDLWEQIPLWKEKYKNLQIDSGLDNPIKIFLKKSRLVICSYFSTAFLECLTSNFPVIMLMKKDSHLIRKNMIDDFNELYNVNIIFDSIQSLSEHLNKNYDKLYDWWESHKLQETRLKFINNHSLENKYFINELRRAILLNNK